jgi:hypothetical protein
MAEFRIEDLSAEQLVYMARKAETSERYEGALSVWNLV